MQLPTSSDPSTDSFPNTPRRLTKTNVSNDFTIRIQPYHPELRRRFKKKEKEKRKAPKKLQPNITTQQLASHNLQPPRYKANPQPDRQTDRQAQRRNGDQIIVRRQASPKEDPAIATTRDAASSSGDPGASADHADKERE